MSGYELATAWVRIVPSVSGIQGAIAEELAPVAKEAAESGKQSAFGFSKNWKKYLGAAAITAGVVAAFKGLYEVGAVFDDVADTIRVGTGATGKDLESLIDTAKSVGKSIPAEWSNVGSTVADINTRMGLTGETLETVASQFLEASRVLGEDVDIMKAGAAFNAFKIQGDAVSGAMDHLFRVSQATGIGMNELAASVQSNAPAVQALGFDFETTTAMVGAFDKAGLNTSQVMMAMSRGLVTLAKDGEEPQEAFKRIVGEMNELIDSGNKAAAIDLASGVFGTRAATQFVGAVEDGVLGLDDLIGTLGMSEDTILGVAKETNDFAEKWKILQNKATAALEPLASGVFTALSDALEWLLPLFDSFSAWLADNQWAIAAFAVVIGVTLVAAFIAWTASVWAATAALLANPVTWIVLAIVALIAALVLLIMNWDAVVEWVSEVWGAFMDWIMGVIDGFVQWWNEIWAAVGSFFTGIWDGFVAWVKGVWDGFVGWIKAALTVFGTFWDSVWEGIGSAFEAVWNGIEDFFMNIWNGIVKFFESGVNGLIGVLNMLIDAYNFVAQAWGGEIDHVAEVNWSSHPSNIPGLYAGGTVLQSGTVLVGERGPELLHLPAGAVVDPDISGSRGDVINVYPQPSETTVQVLDGFRARRV